MYVTCLGSGIEWGLVNACFPSWRKVWGTTSSAQSPVTQAMVLSPCSEQGRRELGSLELAQD